MRCFAILSRQPVTCYRCGSFPSPLVFQAGTLEPLTDLPGMPDGISSAPDGSFWVALFSPTVDAAVLLAPLKLARTFLSFVPSDFLPKVVHPLSSLFAVTFTLTEEQNPVHTASSSASADASAISYRFHN